mgnify:CR=1 FL=1
MDTCSTSPMVKSFTSNSNVYSFCTSPLTAKQQRFVEEYLVDWNATQAAIRAGYSEKTAQQMGAENLTKPMVAEAIEKEKRKISERTSVDQDRVLNELARIGFSDLRKLFTPDGKVKPPEEWDDAAAAAISAIEVVSKPTGETDENGELVFEHVHKIKVWDKNSALEKIAKHLGMFTERVELTGNITVSNLSDEDLDAAIAKEMKTVRGK